MPVRWRQNVPEAVPPEATIWLNLLLVSTGFADLSIG